MKVSAGELRYPVTLRLRSDHAAAGWGTETATDQAIATRARIDAVSGAVYLGSVQVDHTITHAIYIRTRPGITAEWEVVRGATVYRVRRAAPLNGQPEFMKLEVEELGDGNT